MPAELDTGEVITVVAMALALTFLATLYPVLARRAARSGGGAALWVTPRCAALETTSSRRIHKEGEGQLEVFRDLNMSLMPGELVALVGPSGAGKSSLLHMAGLLEAPTSGEIVHRGRAGFGLPDRNAPASAATRSVLSIRPIICCRNSPRSRTSSCRR